MPNFMTLTEFADAAALAVEASGATPENRQAKAVPAERMVRYYTSRGLLSRPGTRGRALVYGRRHLLELVAIKRLQGEGLTLDEIAERLEDLSDGQLATLAAVPAEAIPDGLGDVEPGPARQARRAGRFWEERPAPAEAGSDGFTRPLRLQPLLEIVLADSIRLLVDPNVASIPEPAALHAAAEPLLRLLAPNPGAARTRAPRKEHP